MIIYTIIAGITLLLLAIASMMFGVKFSRANKWAKLFSLYLFSLFSVEIIGKILWFNGENNLSLLHGFCYVEWLILTLFFLANQKEKSDLWFILSGSLFALFVMTFGSLFMYDFDTFNVVGFFGLKLYLMVLSLRELYLFYFERKQLSKLIHFGLILSAIVSMVVFSFGNLLSSIAANDQVYLWLFNASAFWMSLILYMSEIRFNASWKVQN